MFFLHILILYHLLEEVIFTLYYLYTTTNEDKHYVFDRFYSGDKSHTNKSNFGLGLSIAKELTQMLNGTITINDTAGGGATFTVKFPLK